MRHAPSEPTVCGEQPVLEKSAERHRPSDKDKRRAHDLFNSMIRQVVRDSLKRGYDMSEKILRESMRERSRKSKIASARKIKPGTKRWENLLNERLQKSRRRRKS